ncbi:protein SCO1/2 [Roseovarius sp. MBR-154]|jgi:cytochrome oxidase Cu insertion factor (SCO1/SenC/PrrC family)
MTVFNIVPRSARLSLAAVSFLALAAPGLADHSGHDPAAHDHGAQESAGHDHGDAQAGQDDHSGHGDHAGHDMPQGETHATMDHRMPDHLGMDDQNTFEGAMSPDGFQYKRSANDYVMPAVTLRNQNAQKVNFAELMAYDGPVVLNFIFTSCATICPVMSATFGQTQEDLAAIDDSYLMVSISIDPDYDTPRRLRAYADLHAARDNWVMLTGPFDDIFTVVRAFDAVYKGENKMYHRPLTFLRQGKDTPWLRLEGLLGSEELAEEYAALLRPEVN